MVAGRKPKPTEQKRLEGNPGQRPLNEHEPKPRPICPECPEWLSDVAKEKWNELVPKLERTGVLTEIDGDVLAQYCSAFSNWKKYETEAAKEPSVMIAPSGYQQQSPLVAAVMKASALVCKLGELLGLNPSSRSRIVVPPGEGDDDEDFLFGKSKKG